MTKLLFKRMPLKISAEFWPDKFKPFEKDTTVTLFSNFTNCLAVFSKACVGIHKKTMFGS